MSPRVVAGRATESSRPGVGRWLAGRLEAVRAAIGAIPFVLLAAVLGLVALDRRDLTNDEVVSWLKLDDADYRESLTGDRFNVLYYTLLRAWSSIAGDGDVPTRLLSVLLGAAAAGVIYLLARRLLGGRIAGLAAVLVCLNSFFVRYEQTARTYCLALLLVALAAYLLVVAAQRGGITRRLAYAVAASGAIYAHVFAAYVVAAHGAWLAIRRRVDLGWAFTFAGVGLAILPLAWASLYASSQLAWIPATTPMGVVRTFWPLSGGAAVVPDAVLLAGLTVVFAIAGGWSLLDPRRSGLARASAPARSPAAELVVLWLVLGAGLAVLASLAKPSLTARYTIVLLPALEMLVAAGLLAVPHRALQRIALGAVLGLAVAQLWRYETAPYQDWSGADAILAERAAATGEPIVVFPENRILALRHAAPAASKEGGAAIEDILGRVVGIATVTDATPAVWVVFESTETDDAHAAMARLTALGLAPTEDLSAGTVHLLHWTAGDRGTARGGDQR